MAQKRSFPRPLYLFLLTLLEINISYSSHLSSPDDDSIYFPGQFPSAEETKMQAEKLTDRFAPYKNTDVPNQAYCGLKDNHDVQTKPKNGESWPWAVALGYKHITRKNHWLCSGSLITDRHVLTAASCTNKDLGLYLVRIGELKLNKPFNSSIDIPIKKVTSHPESSLQFENDLAILELERPVIFSGQIYVKIYNARGWMVDKMTAVQDKIRPICLPMEPEIRQNHFENQTCYVAGYGKTSSRGPYLEEIQVLEMQVKDNITCMGSYISYEVPIDNRVMCAGINENGRDACQGFSGAPLMVPNGDRYNCIGVTSFGRECGLVEYPGVYTRVASFLDWITETIK